jgi:hypothetical protein
MDKLKERNSKMQNLRRDKQRECQRGKKGKKEKKISGTKLCNSGRILNTQQYVIPNPSVTDAFEG